MIRKTIEIATAGTRLSVSHRQLVIERPELPMASVPLEDIGVLVVDHPQVSCTQAVLTELALAGATLLISGPNHLPVGMYLPLGGHNTIASKHIAQASASLPLQKQAWRSLVQAKLRQQSQALLAFGPDDFGLAEMAKRVKSGDPENLEAQGAQRYWPALFGKNFRRGAEDNPINGLLNYGYAILRAGLGRAIVASGLIPSLGVHHHNRSNPFCLADDLIEPYRPYVDWKAKQLLAQQDGLDAGKREQRAAVLGLLNETISISGRSWPCNWPFRQPPHPWRKFMPGKHLN